MKKRFGTTRFRECECQCMVSSRDIVCKLQVSKLHRLFFVVVASSVRICIGTNVVVEP